MDTNETMPNSTTTIPTAQQSDHTRRQPRVYSKAQGVLEIVLFKAYAELKSEASRFYFSFFWWIVEPVLFMSVFYVVFELVLHRGGEGFVFFLFCGLVPWKWFASTLNQGSNAIVGGRNIIQQVYVGKIVFPLSMLVANTVRFLFVFVILMLVLMVSGSPIRPGWASIALVLATQFILLGAVTTFSAAIVPIVPDLKLVIENGLILMFFMSGIFFDIDKTSGALKEALFLNPMAFIINQYRQVLLNGQWAHVGGLLIIAAASTALIVLSTVLMRRLDRTYPKILM